MSSWNVSGSILDSYWGFFGSESGYFGAAFKKHEALFFTFETVQRARDKQRRMVKSTNICEKHGLKDLLNHVLSPDYELKTGYIEACPNYVPLRSGYDLAPYGRDELYVEGAGKVWREVEDRAVEQVVEDVMANGCGKAGGELLDTRMLGDETTTRVAPAPGSPKPSKASKAGVKIKLKIKK